MTTKKRTNHAKNLYKRNRHHHVHRKKRAPGSQHPQENKGNLQQTTPPDGNRHRTLPIPRHQPRRSNKNNQMTIVVIASASEAIFSTTRCLSQPIHPKARSNPNVQSSPNALHGPAQDRGRRVPAFRKCCKMKSCLSAASSFHFSIEKIAGRRTVRAWTFLVLFWAMQKRTLTSASEAIFSTTKCLSQPIHPKACSNPKRPVIPKHPS